VFYALGVGDALKALSCETAGKEIRLWNTGETWKLFDLGKVALERYGSAYFTVYRPDLLNVLAGAVGAERIHLGAKCLGFMQDANGVDVQFANQTIRGDVLVGADGVHSTVRQALFGADKPQFTGIIAWRGLVPMEKLPPPMARMVGSNWVGPGGHVVHYPLRSGRVMNFVGALERSDWQIESWSARGTTQELAADFAGWHEDVHALIGNIPVPHKWALMTGHPARRRLPFDGAVSRPGRRAVEGSSGNIARFHNRALADPATARAYVEREWAGQRVAERYEWLFRYDVSNVPIQ
jgi:salicylate hydroxylase